MIGRAVHGRLSYKRRNVDIVAWQWWPSGRSLALAGGAFAQEKKPETGNQEEIRALLTVTDEAATGKATSSVALKWEQHHFIKSHGDKTYVPFTVSVDADGLPGARPRWACTCGSPSAASCRRRPRPPRRPRTRTRRRRRQEGRGQGHRAARSTPGTSTPSRTCFFIDTPAPVAGQPQLLRRARLPVSPGDYDVYVALKEKRRPPARPASPKIGVLKHELTVPSLDGELTTSSVITAAKIDILQTELAARSAVGEPVHVRHDQDRAVARQQVQEDRRVQHHVLDLRRRGRRRQEAQDRGGVCASTRRQPTARSSSTRPSRR